jgi:hypothetical protein
MSKTAARADRFPNCGRSWIYKIQNFMVNKEWYSKTLRKMTLAFATGVKKKNSGELRNSSELFLVYAHAPVGAKQAPSFNLFYLFCSFRVSVVLQLKLYNVRSAAEEIVLREIVYV